MVDDLIMTDSMDPAIILNVWKSAILKLNLTLKSAIFQYGNLRGTYKLNITSYNMATNAKLLIKLYMTLVSRKELAEAIRFRTHSWTILVSNPAALIITFLEDLRYKENK